VCHQFSAFAWTPAARSPLEIIAAHSAAERVGAHEGIIHLHCLNEFAWLRNVRFGLVALQHAIQEPDNETVHQQNERAYDSRMMPNVTHFERNQGGCRKYHE